MSKTLLKRHIVGALCCIGMLQGAVFGEQATDGTVQHWTEQVNPAELPSLSSLKLDYAQIRNVPRNLEFVYQRETADGKRVQTGTIMLSTLIEGRLVTLVDRFNLVEADETLDIEVRSFCMLARLLRPSAIMANWQSTMRDEQARIVVAGNNAQRWDRENKNERIRFSDNTLTSSAAYRMTGLLPREDGWLARVDVFVDSATMNTLSPVVVRCEAVPSDDVDTSHWQYAWHSLDETSQEQGQSHEPILQVTVNEHGVPVQIRFPTGQWQGTVMTLEQNQRR